MIKTYTKIILGIITFLSALFGPFSVIVQPISQQAETNIPTVGIQNNISYGASICSATWPNQPDCIPASSKVTPTNSDLAVTLESFLKVVYVILRPALFIAGLAMDNSLVYGEIFGLDSALFKFWQIMKNFANFALGFIFIWSILKYIFDLKWWKATNPKDIIVKLLLWAIWVNTSWFIIGALVDISTALTVGIGWLPLQLIGDQDIGNKPIFWSITSIKLNDAVWQRDNAAILHTRPGSKFTQEWKYFLPCYIEDSHIVWDKPWQNAFGVSNTQTDSVTGTTVAWTQIVQNYCVARWNGINKEVYVWAWSPNIQDWAAMKSVYTGSFAALESAGWCSTSKTCQTLNSFTKKTEWYQWAFYSLYASLLNLSTIHIWVPKSNVSLGMEMLIKLIVALAYLIPLLILAVVLIMRVGYLWLIIAFSPFIVLASIKGVWDKMKGGIKDETLKKVFDIEKVISLLLLPVVVTFTISLSIVFLSSLSEWLTKNGSSEAMWIYQRTEWTYKCYDVAITSICLDMPGQDIGTGIFDYFSWMIMNLFGIWLMWFAVMAALKSSEFTAKVAGTIETLGKDMMMSANFIPIPGWKKWDTTSLWALKALPSDISRRLESSRNEWSELLYKKAAWMKNDIMGADKKVNQAITTTTDTMNTSNSSFASQKAQLVADINSDKFKAAENMSFWQADNSLAFANMLAEKTWSKHRFNNWQELFTSIPWQEILGKWLSWTSVNWDKLWSMYAHNESTEAKSWEKTKEELEKVIKTGTDALPQLNEEEIKKIRDEKKIFEGKDKGKEFFMKNRTIFTVTKGSNKIENTLDMSKDPASYEEAKKIFEQINNMMTADIFIKLNKSENVANDLNLTRSRKIKNAAGEEKEYMLQIKNNQFELQEKTTTNVANNQNNNTSTPPKTNA
jgi:hypothetical protein